ncbi:hypothetical protein [Desulfogranum japonicum]|uniref:hypothetical protein n=1 Tax=Desulfogranum japonicum TaxID=231447 RepID=UPI00048CA727|nr:hypothetical protein [Desulfogranum japonicum]
MYFSIQISNPSSCKNVLDFADNLEDAIESLFYIDTEDAVMNWNGVRLPLSYKYDISVICEDIIGMLESIVDNEKGELFIEWPSNTFRTDWSLKWEGDSLDCKSSWFDVSGNIENILNCSGVITLDKTDFVSEWAGLLKKIMECLFKAGYTADLINSLERMSKILKKIPKNGRLYRNG